jgi:hypothetical protein
MSRYRLLLIALLPVPCYAQDILVRRKTEAPPTSFQELRVKPASGPAPTKACSFPDSLFAAGLTVSLDLADSTSVALPDDWRVREPAPTAPARTPVIRLPDSVSAHLTPEQLAQVIASISTPRSGPDVRLVDRDSNLIFVTRKRNGADGRNFPMYRNGATPEGDGCLIDRGTLGAIWTLYEPDPSRQGQRFGYSAYGDVMTPGGFWYSLVVNSESPVTRLRALRVLTTAFLGRAAPDSSKPERVSVPDRHPLFELAARWAGPGADVGCTLLGPEAAFHGEPNARRCRWSSRLAASDSNQVEAILFEATGSSISWSRLALDAGHAARVIDSLRNALRARGLVGYKCTFGGQAPAGRVTTEFWKSPALFVHIGKIAPDSGRPKLMVTAVDEESAFPEVLCRENGERIP